MNSRDTSRFGNVVWVGLLGLILLAALALPAGAARWLGDARGALERAVQPAAAATPDSTNLTYVGTVKLEWAMPGEFDDPVPTPTSNPDTQAPPPPDLGDIDLGLALTRSGDTISGYVDLDFTLVFTREHTVGATAYGPSVAGTFDGTNLMLTSEQVSSVISGQRLMRQFWLSGGAVPGQADTLSGQYRETIWGYGPRPLTVIGTFTLQRSVAAEAEPSPTATGTPPTSTPTRTPTATRTNTATPTATQTGTVTPPAKALYLPIMLKSQH